MPIIKSPYSDSLTVTPGDAVQNDIAQAGKILSALGGGYVCLSDGVFRPTAACAIPSNVQVVGAGRQQTIIKQSFTGAADSATNAVFTVIGALDTATLNTTLSSTKGRGSTTWALTAAQSAMAGTYILVAGNPSASNSYGDSDGSSVNLQEIAKVSSIAGTTATLADLSKVHHVSANTAKAVLPVINTAFRNMSFDGTGGTVACAISAQYAINVEIDAIDAIGFSKSIIYAIACHHINGGRIFNRGTCNGIVHLDSVQASHFDEIRCLPVGNRTHASGTPRWALWTRNRCTDVTFEDFNVRGMCGGVMAWGGRDCRWTGSVESCIPDAAYNAMVTAGEMNNTQSCGVAYNGGAAPLAVAENQQDYYIDIESANHQSSLAAFAAGHSYIHDQLNGFVNIRARGTGTGAGMSAHVISDSTGYAVLDAIGCTYGIRTENRGWGGTINFGYVPYNEDVTGGGTIAYPLGFSHTNPMGHILFERCSITTDTAAGVITTGGSFGTSSGDHNIWFRDVAINSYYMNGGTARLAYHNYAVDGVTISQGDAVMIDASNSTADITYVKTPTGIVQSGSMGVVLSGAPLDPTTRNSYLIVAFGPAAEITLTADTACAAGDLLESANATRSAHKNNSSTNWFATAIRSSAGAGVVVAEKRG